MVWMFAGQLFSRVFLNLGFSYVFLMIILKLYKHLAKIPWKYHCVPLSSLSPGDTWYQPISLLLMLRLISQLLWCLPDCSSRKVTISAFVFNYCLRSDTSITSCFSKDICLDFIIHQWSVPTQLLLWCLCNDNFVFYPIDYNSILSFILMLKLFLALASGSSSRLTPVSSPSPGINHFFNDPWFPFFNGI